MGWINNLFQGAKNIFGGAGQAIGNVVGAGANVGKNLFGQIGKGAGNAMSMFGGMGQGGSPKPATSMPSQNSFSMPLLGSMGGSQRMGAMTSPVSQGAGIANQSNPDKPKNWMDNLFPGGKAQGIAGLAAPLMGDLFAPKSPNIPDMGSLASVQALQNFKPGQSVSPEYQQMIQKNTQQLRDQKVRELQQLYHNARPGTDYLTDTNYQRDLALLDQGIQENMTNELTKAEATFSQQEQERLSQIAQMDIYSIMAQTGLKAQEAQQFKEMFGNVGNMFLTNATRNPNDLSNIMSLFGGNN